MSKPKVGDIITCPDFAVVNGETKTRWRIRTVHGTTVKETVGASSKTRLQVGAGNPCMFDHEQIILDEPFAGFSKKAEDRLKVDGTLRSKARGEARFLVETIDFDPSHSTCGGRSSSDQHTVVVRRLGKGDKFLAETIRFSLEHFCSDYVNPRRIEVVGKMKRGWKRK